MPTYEYKCPECGHFEIEQRMTDAPLAACPTCGAAVKRLMPRKLYIQFKGPGFHVNDYPSGHRAGSSNSEAKHSIPEAPVAPLTANAGSDAKKAATEI